MFVELAPVLLALPTLLVSQVLTVTVPPESPDSVTAYLLLNWVQSMFFASLSLVTMMAIFSYISVHERSKPGNGGESIASPSETSWFATVNNMLYLWTPLVFFFLSTHYLGLLRVISLFTVCQMLSTTSKKSSHRSFQMENNYSVSDCSFLLLFYKKFQVYIIFLLSFIFDLIYGLYFEKEKLLCRLFGYVLFITPFFALTTNALNDKISSSNLAFDSNIKIHLLIAAAALLKLVYSYMDVYNFKMMLVSIGSLIILLFSQFESNTTNKLKLQVLIKDIVSPDLLLQHYKLNYLTLNAVVLVITFLNESVNPDFSFAEAFAIFVGNYAVKFSFNILVMFLLNVENSLMVGTRNAVFDTTKADAETTLFGLFVQLINSDESKSIFNFLLLNVAFMFIQLLYSFRSKSLSLLSDSLHMLLDCTSLLLGLMASIISKNNLKTPSQKYPFGLNRIKTLSGFTNGSLLLGIVFGIYNESIQRFLNPVKLENTTELLIVSFLGFLVNLVGIFAFNHGHDHSHGHSHGHSHSHGHGHSHSPEISQVQSQDQSHSHSHGHDSSYKSCPSKDQSTTCTHSHDHDHDEQHNDKEDNHTHSHNTHETANEKKELEIKIPIEPLEDDDCSGSIDHHDDDNMHGIFLHIMADTLGSVGVIISTIVVKMTGWNFVDPLASMMIASLIFLSAIPLLKSSSANLLLSLPDDTEEELKYLLNEVLKIPGVKSYTTPRFWPQDGPKSNLIGYLHVQYFRTENSTHIKTNIDRLFSKSSAVKTFYLQLENEVDECWCRKDGVFSTY